MTPGAGSPGLEEAEARAGILQTIAVFCHAFDRRRWDIFGELFDGAAVCSLSKRNEPWREWVDHAKKFSEEFLRLSHHQLGSTLIVTMDENSASAETYVTARFGMKAHLPGGEFIGADPFEFNLTVGGRFVDRLTKRGENHWRIAARDAIVTWRNVQPVNDPDLKGIRERGRNGHLHDAETVPLIDAWLRQRARGRESRGS